MRGCRNESKEGGRARETARENEKEIKNDREGKKVGVSVSTNCKFESICSRPAA